MKGKGWCMSRRLISEDQYHEYYRTYMNQYYRSKAYIESKSGKARDVELLTYNEFKTDFESELADYSKMSPKAVTIMMAKHDAYSLTWKQAKNLAEAHVKQYGGDVNPKLIIDYRSAAMNPDNVKETVLKDIKRRRAQLFSKGHDEGYVKRQIGQEFFGSK